MAWVMSSPREMSTLLLATVLLLWCSVFSVLVHLRHARFGSFDFDSGIFDQAVWLLARGQEFNTVRGLDVFGNHASVAYYLLVPFSWMGAGSDFLNVLQVLSLGLAAVAVNRIALHHLQNPWMAVALATAFLLHPSVQWFAQELFHPEVVAIAPLLFAYLAALQHRWLRFAALALLAMAWKEDVALAVVGLGAVLLARRQWRPGILTVAGGAAWFLLATLLVQHKAGGVFYAQQFYGDFGSTSAEVAQTVVTHPGRVLDRLQDADASQYGFDIASPYGLTSLLSPLTLVIGSPQALLNLISVQDFTWRTQLHYAALPVASATIAMVESVARFRRIGVRRFIVGLVVAAAWGATLTSGAAPVSAGYAQGIWPLRDDARQPVLEAAVKVPPPDAAVSASYRLIPHLTHRESIYSFPNPWVLRNFGLDNTVGPDPAIIEWLVVDRTSIGQADSDLLDRVLMSGEFVVVTDRDSVVVAARSAYCSRRPAACRPRG